MSVGLVIVSHSEKLAQGVVDVAEQMAADVTIVAAGGTDDGGIGTSLEKVMAALGTADSGDGVVVLCDLGSAVMTAESALEFMGNPETVLLADAPLVEGAVAAAVAAQSGASVGDVKAAAQDALVPHGRGQRTPSDGLNKTSVQPSAQPIQGQTPEQTVEQTVEQTAPGDAPEQTAPGDAPASSQANSPANAVHSTVTLVNPMGLHARPAAVLAGGLGAMDVDVDINGADGQSVMMLMTLAAGKGTDLNITAEGPDATKAVDFIRTEVERGFGEL